MVTMNGSRLKFELSRTIFRVICFIMAIFILMSRVDIFPYYVLKAPQMASRASLLLAREQYWIQKNGIPKGISYSLVKSNIFHWHVTIRGLEGTPWEGGIFQLELYFDESFNQTPPDVFFLTVPFHPNIDIRTGRPCISFLDDAAFWNPSYTVETILLHLQSMLSDPGLENPINVAAAEMLMKYPHLYNQLVYDSVVASRRLVAGMPLFEESKTEEPAAPGQHQAHVMSIQTQTSYHGDDRGTKVTSRRPQKAVMVSFEHYHQEWKSMATSISHSPLELAFQSASTHRLFAVGGFSPRARLSDEQYQDLMQKQRLLWYGNLGVKKSKSNVSEKKADVRKERIESLRRIYNLRTSIDAQQENGLGDALDTFLQDDPVGTHPQYGDDQAAGGASSLGESNSKNNIERLNQLPASGRANKRGSSGNMDYRFSERASRAVSGKSSHSEFTTGSTRSAESSMHSSSTRPWTGASSGIARTESRPTTGRDSNWEAEADDLVEWSQELPS